MQKEDVIIGVHGAHSSEGGRYNTLGTCTNSLVKAFQKNGIQAYSVKECADKNMKINFTIGLNVTGYEIWNEILAQKIPNIMWNVDSIFYQNMEVVDKYYDYPNFRLLTVTPCDQNALAKYFPELGYAYLPGAIDLDLWEKQDCEKEFDVVYFSSIFDYEQRLQDIKNNVTPSMFAIMSDIYELALVDPNLSFWEMVQIVSRDRDIDFNKDGYHFLCHNLVYAIDYARRVKLVQSLSKFNLKVFGNPAWKKYISGNIEYMGEVDYRESVNIINKTKIFLHSEPLQICSGINERVLNASALETFTLARDLKSLKTAFGDSLGFYNGATLEDTAEKVNYFLTHNDERVAKAKEARIIVEQNHTLTHRVKTILSMGGIENLD